MVKFPKIIYVKWEHAQGDNDDFLVADKSPNGEHGRKIAIYELASVRTMNIEETLK